MTVGELKIRGAKCILRAFVCVTFLRVTPSTYAMPVKSAQSVIYALSRVSVDDVVTVGELKFGE